jgi:ABC-type branched-subunit amino acid transport system ATPase component
MASCARTLPVLARDVNGFPDSRLTWYATVLMVEDNAHMALQVATRVYALETGRSRWEARREN